MAALAKLPAEKLLLELHHNFPGLGLPYAL